MARRDPLHWLARAVLVVLIVTEALGQAHVLTLQPQFTWSGLLWQAVAALLAFEVLAWLDRRFDLRLNVGGIALLFAVLTAADATGDILHWYEHLSWFDQVMHFSGGVMAGWATTSAYLAARARHAGAPTRPEIIITGASFAALLGVLYELSEYYGDLLTGSHRLGDGFDTANDLSLDLYGGLLAAVVLAFVPRLRLVRRHPERT
ncbi:MAG: hypothetical protein U0514_01565 [Candidatus Andersenbacteria bacterium]